MKRTLVLSALAVASSLALTACGEATESGNTDATTSATSTATTTAETTETTTATTEADGEISADHNDADIMFAQMMIPHHQQAVEMSEMLLAKEGIPAHYGLGSSLLGTRGFMVSPLLGWVMFVPVPA